MRLRGVDAIEQHVFAANAHADAKAAQQHARTLKRPGGVAHGRRRVSDAVVQVVKPESGHASRGPVPPGACHDAGITNAASVSGKDGEADHVSSDYSS